MTLEEMQARAKQLVTDRRSVVDGALAEKRGLSDDEKTKVEKLDSERSALELAIEDRKADAAAEKAEAEARSQSGLDQIPTANVRVASEPRTYNEHSRRGYYWDLAQAADRRMPEHEAANQRLARHNYELAVEVASGTKEGRAIENVVRTERRTEGAADSVIAEMRRAGKDAGSLESRALTTGTGAGGAFAPPVYLLDLYAPFRTAGRSFIDALNQKPMPDTGMTIDIPAIGNAAGVATQATQNTQVTETDPNAAYLSANVTTLSGEITVSQQLLDRTGPWDGSYDQVMFDQLTRMYNTQADQYALNAALAGAGSTTTSTAVTLQSIYSKVSGLSGTIRSTNGVFRNPTVVFTQPMRWSWMTAQTDGQNRPLIVPNLQQPMNAMAAGEGDMGVEGFAGFNMIGLDVYQDANLPTPAAGNDQIIVLDPTSVLCFEGDLVPRVLPQTLGNQLSVILQVYAYIAILPLYPLAVQSLSGSGFSAPTF